MKRPLCFFCFFFLVLLRVVLGIFGPPEDPYAGKTGDVCARGIVSGKENRNGKVALCLERVRLTGDGGESGAEELSGLLCFADEGAEVPPVGARIEVNGRLRTYPAATNPGEFDLHLYYLYKGYGARLEITSWRDIGGGNHDRWREGLWRLKCRLAGIYDRIFIPEDAGVMRSVVLGDKGDLSGDLKELYRVNGIVHILAISGLHISILGMGFYRLLRRLTVPVFPAAAVSVAFMANYAVFVGAGVSTVRAVTMFGILALAESCRRSYDLPTALLISAACTAVFNPYELFLSAFWLSYLAVIGIAVFFPALTEGLPKRSGRSGKLLGALGGSAATSLFTLPLILSCYYEVPLYAPLLNLVVIPLMSALMIFGLIALLLGAFCPPAGIAAGLPCHLILTLYTKLCEAIGTLPGHSLILGCPSVFSRIAAYVLFFFVLLLSGRNVARLKNSPHPAAGIGRKILGIRPQKKEDVSSRKNEELRRILILRLCCCAAAVLLSVCRVRSGLTLTILDVGQGDGICIAAEDAVLMIDGGSTSRSELAKYQLLPFLKYSGISRVDCWYVTHPDADHDSGLMEILEAEASAVRIGMIVLPDACGAEEDFSELIASAGKHGIPVRYNSAGKTAVFGGLTVECLHPRAGYRTEDVNAYSQVLSVSGYGFRGLFTGDATTESEVQILEGSEENGADTVPGGYDVLKLGHHGSHTSSSQEFLAFVHPRIALISCGFENRYGHPHEDVLERLAAEGCAVYRTDLDGAVILTARGGRIRLLRYAPRE